MKPAYLKLSKDGLKQRGDKAWQLLAKCQVCPRNCQVNRLKDEKGFCQMGKLPVINSYHAHFGEERPLVGRYGSGTIFFSSCNLACLFCQNFQISHLRVGQQAEIDELAEMMIDLQEQGCHNINFVSPTIWVPQIFKALIIARDKCLKLPLVYNSGGYDSLTSLKLLDGVIDIYMPDFKYSDNKIAKKYSLVDIYWETAKKAIKEMHQQVGDLIIDENGIAQRGLLIRHLVLPNNLAGTERVMEFLAGLSKDTYLNIMDQYYPCYQANQFIELKRRLTLEEFLKAKEIAKNKGLYRFDK